MTLLSWFSIYMIGCLLTYKFAIDFLESNVKRYPGAGLREIVSIFVGIFWIAFWVWVVFIGTPLIITKGEHK